MIDVNVKIVKERKKVSSESVIHCYYDYFLFTILFPSLLVFVILIPDISTHGKEREDDIYYQHNRRYLFSTIKQTIQKKTANGMSSQIVPIRRTNNDSAINSPNKTDIWFDAFNFAPGQDQNIRWLSRPNQQLVQEKYSHDAEKFRITFDAENFQPDQIKVNTRKNNSPILFILLDLYSKS